MMKTYATMFLLLILITSGIFPQQWTQTKGPQGGFFSGICAKGTDLFAVTTRGNVFKFSGSRWNFASNAGLSVRDIAATDNNLFIATYNNVRKSTDNGATWNTIFEGYEPVWHKEGDRLYVSADDTIYYTDNEGGAWIPALEGYSARTMLFGDSVTQELIRHTDFVEKDSIFLLGCTTSVYPIPQGVYKTTDNGLTWRYDTGLADPTYLNKFIIFNDKIYAGSSRGVYVTNNNGESWSAVNSGITANMAMFSVYEFIVFDGSLYMVGNSDSSVTVYKLNGNQWENTNLPSLASGITVYDGTLVVSTYDGIYAYLDGVWCQMTQEGLYTATASVYAIREDFAYAVANLKSYKTMDGGNTWSVDPVNGRYFTSGGGKVFAVNGNGIFRANADGDLWTEKSNGIPASYRDAINSIQYIDGVLYVTCSKLRGREHLPPVWEAGGIYMSTNLGETWESLNNGFPSEGGVAVPLNKLAVNGSVMVASTYQGIYRSVNGGNWALFTSGLPGNYSISNFATYGNDIIVSSYYGVYKTSAAGNGWELFSSGLPQGDNLFNIYIKFLPVENDLYLISQTGETTVAYQYNGMQWMPVDLNIPQYNFSFINFSSAGKVAYTGIADFGVWKVDFNPLPVELTSFTASVNGGKIMLNWETATETNNKGFEIERVSSPAASVQEWKTIGFMTGAGTTTEQKTYSFVDNNPASGKYSYRLKQVDYQGTYTYSGIVEVNFSLPVKYALEQNYPNPFNPSTTIRFSLASNSRVVLKVYNSLGEEVAHLADGNYPAGEQLIDFNAGSLGSGIYFYRIEAKGEDGREFISVKKMLLLK